jgi:hypothetical protein
MRASVQSFKRSARAALAASVSTAAPAHSANVVLRVTVGPPRFMKRKR